MRPRARKTTPRVRDGKVQRKNRTDLSPHYRHAEPGHPIVDRQRPGAGYRHFLLQRDVEKFIELLPDWEELSCGLRGVVLAPGKWNCMGWHTPGVVAVCAWERKMAYPCRTRWLDDRRPLLQRLEVGTEPGERGWELVHWTEPSIRGFQLLDVLLHELGHHHDRMTTRSQRRAARGEPYAESYAREYADEIWDRYIQVFEI